MASGRKESPKCSTMTFRTLCFSITAAGNESRISSYSSNYLLISETPILFFIKYLFSRSSNICKYEDVGTETAARSTLKHVHHVIGPYKCSSSNVTNQPQLIDVLLSSMEHLLILHPLGSRTKHSKIRKSIQRLGAYT